MKTFASELSFIVGASVLVFACLTTVAFAQQGPGGGGEVEKVCSGCAVNCPTVSGCPETKLENSCSSHDCEKCNFWNKCDETCFCEHVSQTSVNFDCKCQ